MTTLNQTSTRSNPLFKLLANLSWRLATKLTIITLVAILVPQLIASGINLAVTRTSAVNQVGRDIVARQAQATNDTIVNYLAGQISILDTLTADPNLQSWLKNSNGGYIQMTESEAIAVILERDEVWRNNGPTSTLILQTTSDNEVINPGAVELYRYTELFPEHAELFVTDQYGGTASSTNILSDYYQADEGWWQAAWNNGEGAVFISNPEFDDSAGVVASQIALPVRDEDGQILGILRTTLALDAIVAEINSVNIGETGAASLYQADGMSIVQGESADTFTPDFIASFTDLPDRYRTLRLDGTNTVIGYAQMNTESEEIQRILENRPEAQNALENLDWQIMVQQETGDAINEIMLASAVPIALGLIAALLGLLLARWLMRATTRQIDVMLPVFNRIESGDYSSRAEVLTRDELGDTANAFNQMLDNTVNLIQSEEERATVQASIMKLLDEVTALADGDLTAEAEVTDNITGAIADSFNFMAEQLRDVILNVQDATIQVSSSASEVATTAEHLAQGSESQASQIVDTSAAIDEMSISIQQVSENAVLGATIGEQARENARVGAGAVRDTIEGMGRIRQEVEATARRIERLGVTSQEITTITRVINSIAERTGILAINASIQASEAGEAGRGFAVVAEEVERLAERSAKAASQINQLIRAIQQETNGAVTAMEATTAEVARGSQLAHEAGERLDEIETVSSRLSDLILSISQAAQQQARGSESIALSMNEIAEVTQQTAAGTRQATTTITTLAQLADGLRSSVSTFKVSENGSTV